MWGLHTIAAAVKRRVLGFIVEGQAAVAALARVKGRSRLQGVSEARPSISGRHYGQLQGRTHVTVRTSLMSAARVSLS